MKFYFFSIAGAFFLSLLWTAPDAAAQNATPMENTVQATIVELTSFQLVAGAEEQQFLQSAEAMQQAFLQHQPGFSHRTLVRGEQGWTDVVYWLDETSLKEAMKKAESAPEVAPFMQMIDFSTVQMNVSQIQYAAN